MRDSWLRATFAEMLHFALFFAIVIGLLLLLIVVLAHV